MSDYEGLIFEINRRTELIYLFEELIDPDSLLPKIFLMHRQDLFPSFEQMDIAIPLIFWVNTEFTKVKITGFDTLTIAKRLSELETTKSWDMVSSLISSWKELIMDPIMKTFEQNPELREWLLRSIFEGKTISSEPNHEIIKDFDPKKIEKNIKKLINDLRQNPLLYLDIIKNIFPDIFIYLHLESLENVHRLMRYAKINLKDYHKIINQLFRFKLINNLDTMLFCNNCSEPFVLRSKSNLSPKVLKLKCINCGKTMSISSIYQLDKFLWRLISSTDGLLGITVGWLLKKKNVDYNKNVFIEDIEIDFICDTQKGIVLLECKMHRVPPIDKAHRDRSVRQMLINDFKQLDEHINIYESKFEKKVTESYLIYNINLTEYKEIILEEIKKHKKSQIIDFIQLNEVITSIAPKKE